MSYSLPFSSYSRPFSSLFRIQYCLEALDVLESLKPDLNQRHARYMAGQLKARNQEKAVAERNRAAVANLGPASATRSTQEWSLQEELKGVMGIGAQESSTKYEVET